MTAHEIAQKLAALNTDEVFDQIFKALIAPMLDNQTIPEGGIDPSTTVGKAYANAA